MSTDALLTPPRPGEGPRWRVAVARTAGQTAKITAADAIAQFRAAGCMATEIDVTRADPFIDHRTEWAGRGRPDAYDLVVVTGDLSPAVVALAVLADAPVVRLPIGSRPSLLGAIDSAVQADAVQTVPVAQVSIDGDRRFTRDAVHVAPDSIAAVALTTEHGATEITAFDRDCAIRATEGPGWLIEVAVPDRRPIHCRQIELRDDDLTLRVDFDSRSRRARQVGVSAVAGGLRLLRPSAWQ